jgi:hypothetical protein
VYYRRSAPELVFRKGLLFSLSAPQVVHTVFHTEPQVFHTVPQVVRSTELLPFRIPFRIHDETADARIQ